MVVGMMMGWGSVTDQQEWRKGPWTPEEDKLLTEYVKLHGEGRWSSVARSAGLKRSGKSCRLRWVNYLRPGLRRGHLTPQEEGIIIELHALWGNKWSTIARYLPGRTDNEIKNYWRTHFKKKPKVSDRKAKRSSLINNNINSAKKDEEINNTDQLFNQTDDHTLQISSGQVQPPAMTYSAQYPNMEMINPAGLPAQHSGGQFGIGDAAVSVAHEAWLTDTVPVDGLWGWLWNFDDDQISGAAAAGGVNHGMKSQYADSVNQNGGLVRWGSCSFGFDMHQNGAYIS